MEEALLSRKAAKRVARRAKNDECKELRRERRREKRRSRRTKLADLKRKELNGLSTDERYARKEAQTQAELEQRARLARNKLEGELQVCVCLQFLPLMNEKEARSLVKQMQLMRNVARDVPRYSLRLSFCPLDLAQEPPSFFVAYLLSQGAGSWDDVNFLQQEVHEAFAECRSCGIFLSPDATQVLTAEDLDDSRNFFIIGGIVDRSVTKNISLNLAQDLKFRAKRLPIRENCSAIHPILNLDTVLKILAAVKFDQLNWTDAILQSIPQRRVMPEATPDLLPKANPLLLSD